jgi:curli biogenesis system outer membrane secretion channel CsgG
MKIPVSKRPIVAVIITIIAICSSLPLQADAAGPKVAVLDFTDYSGAGLNMWDSPKAAAELLQVFLTKAGFGTVERDKLTLILQEQRLSITQLVDSASHAIQVGRLAGADFIVTGAILSLGVEVVSVLSVVDLI